MVANVAGTAGLPSEIMEEIAERTDGVPLFIEELTKAVMESGPRSATALSVRVASGAVGAGNFARLADGAARSAGTGCQGCCADGGGDRARVRLRAPDVHHRSGGPQLRKALDRLTSAGLLFVRGTLPESSYMFKHALVQDAAYGTLLRSRRLKLHSRIAAALEDRFPEIVLAQPALLAQHCAAAGLAEKAVAYWLLGRSAGTVALGDDGGGLPVAQRVGAAR